MLSQSETTPTAAAVAPRHRRFLVAANERVGALVASDRNGLPNSVVLAWFPALLGVVLIVLVALGITGSSTGFLHQFFSSDRDAALLAGEPQAIRSDEWAVQTAWTISQVEQGLPVENQTFPGGSDSTVQSDLPSTDWSVAFRPHLLGFLFLPLDNAAALKWWLPGLAMIAAAYLFLASLMPRRPLTAAALSVGFFFAPFFQWWYLPVTFWPVAWSFVVMAAAVWLIRGTRIWPKVVLSALAGYLTVTMGMGVYVPFIVPVVLVAVAFVVGLSLTRHPLDIAGTIVRRRVVQLIPLISAGVAGVTVLVIWLATRAETIERFLATVYPGQRFESTGDLGRDELVSLFGAPVTRALSTPNVPLGQNASEASTFFLIGLFLVVPLLWFLVRDRRSRKAVDWTIASVLAAGLVAVAFLLVPGWDGLAHALLLDRTTTERIRLAIGLLSVVGIALTVSRADEHRLVSGSRPPRVLALAATFLAALSIIVLFRYLFLRDAPIVTQGSGWMVLALGTLLAVYLFARGRALGGAAVFLAISAIGSAGVNPVYVGVYDLNDTRIVQQMKALQDDNPGAWVGIGGTFVPTAVLVHSGLPGYNGFQGAPPPEMWEQIDPSGSHEEAWNRLANISWVAGSGDPQPRNPAPDQIQMTFDSCDEFAQEEVTYVLALEELDQSCVREVVNTQEGPTNFFIYEVVR